MNENHYSYQFNTKQSKTEIGHLAYFRDGGKITHLAEVPAVRKGLLFLRHEGEKRLT